MTHAVIDLSERKLDRHVGRPSDRQIRDCSRVARYEWTGRIVAGTNNEHGTHNEPSPATCDFADGCEYV